MTEEIIERRMNRRTRGERNKRRERYFLSNGKGDPDSVASSTDSQLIENNNCVKGRTTVMGNKVTVDIFLFFYYALVHGVSKLLA